MKRTIVFFLVLFNCGLKFAAMAGSNSANEEGLYFITNYTPRDYKAGSQNWAVVQDKRGVMYFGNGVGVLEYDGVSWRKILTADRTSVRSLAMDADGTIFVGAQGDFGYLLADAAGQMSYVSLADKIPSPYPKISDVWGTHAARECVYFQSMKSLFRYKKGMAEIKFWEARTEFDLSFMVRDQLYVFQLEIGLMKMNGDSLELAPAGEQFARDRIYAMIPYDAERILIAARKQGLFIYDGKEAVPFSTEAAGFLAENQIYHGAALNNGMFALGTNRGGVVIIDKNGRIQQLLDKSSGVQNNVISFVYQDRQGGLWLALDNGITRVEALSPLTIYGEHAGLKGSVLAMIRHQGTFYAATSLGVFYLTPQTLNPKDGRTIARSGFTMVPGIATQCWSLASAGKSLLVATIAGVYRIDENRATLIQQAGTSLFLQRSRVDPNVFYVALNKGLAWLRLKNGQFIDEGKVPGIDEDIRTITEDKDGRLWLGTRFQGVLRATAPALPGGGAKRWIVERFGSRDGLPQGTIRVFPLWGGTAFATNTGLFRFDPSQNSFAPDTRLGARFADSAASITNISQGQQGEVWLVCSYLDRDETILLVRDAANAFSEKKTSFLRFMKFDIYRVFQDDNGIVWFGWPDGLIRYDPHIRKNHQENFMTLIRRVMVKDDSVLFWGGPAVPGKRQAGPRVKFKDNTVRFEYAATSFDSEADNQYQCFLEGLKETWSGWSKDTKKEYINISEGHYRFHVRAKNIYDHLGEECVYEFTILPPWQRTWWAFGLYGLLAMAGIWAIVHARSLRLLREKQLLELLVKQRTADLAQRTDELAQKEKQLEKIDLIVRAINTKLTIDDFLKSLLNEIAFTEKIHHAAVLMADSQSGTFRFSFVRGWTMAQLSSIRMTPEESKSRYAPASGQVAEDIFLIPLEDSVTGDDKFVHLDNSKSMLVLKIQDQQGVSGYIIFDRMKDEEPFTAADIQLLSMLRPHILSGFIRARLLTDLKQANEELKKLNDTKSEFLGIAAHDLRSPLSVIIGYIDLIVHNMKLNRFHIGEAVADLEKVLKSAWQMVNLITELLDISAIESGKVTLNFQQQNINLIFEECEKTHRRHADMKNILLEIDQNEELPDLMIDKSRIAEVVDNLLSNAIKYTHPSGRVRVYSELLPEEVRVHVQDSGQGLNDDDLRQIFKSFRKLSARPTGGEASTGFGLAIVKKIVELHNGRVWVASKANEGSTFSFSLPLPFQNNGRPQLPFEI